MADTPEAVLAAAQGLKGKKVKVTLGPNLTVTGKLLEADEDCVELEVGGRSWRTPKVLPIEEVRDA